MDATEATRFIEGLIEAWGPSLARQAYRMTGDREVSEDLVQEAFLALYQELRKGVRIGNPRAWTLTVVRNQAAKRHRRPARRWEQLEPGDVLDRIEAQAAPAEAGFDDLMELIGVLTSREQEVLLLRLDCLKYREIADCLGIDESSVSTHLARAVRKLQAEVKAREAGLPVRKREDVRETLQ